MPTLSKGLLRDLRSFLLDDDPVPKSTLVRWAEEIDAAIGRGSRAKRLRRSRRREKAETRKDVSTEIRARVVERSGGKCEACLDPLTSANPGEWDHVLGGVGRRIQQQSVESTWFLHATCHRERTANQPSARHWWEIFRAHALRAGYAAMVREAEKHL
jgi:hypothetical protein